MASARDLLARARSVAEAQSATSRVVYALEALIAIAFTDPLTKLHNRRALDEIMKLPLAFEGNTYGAIMLDLTAFKRINEEGGHLAGDAALERVGETLQRLCEHGEPFGGALPFRYGGDEFFVLVPSSIFDGFIEPSNLVKLTWKDFTFQEKPFGFGASVGIAKPDADIEMRKLVQRADVAANVSKHNEDRPIVWTASIEHEAMDDLRKRCAECFATISVHVAKAKRVADGFKTCPNCGAGL